MRAFYLLQQMTRHGHYCVAISSDANHLIEPPKVADDHLLQKIDGVQFCWVKTRKYTGAKSAGRIVSWLHFEWRLFRLEAELPAPDVVIVSSLSLLTIFNGMRLRWRYGCRLIFEVRDIWPLTIVEEGGFGPMNPFVLGLALIEKLAYKVSDAIVGTMPNLDAHVRAVSKSTVPVHCIPMGVAEADLLDAEPLPASFADKYFPSDKFVVCHAGTIGISNALDTLFQCAVAMQDNPNIYFLIVGDGDLKDSYRQRYGHLPNVGFAPSVPKSMVQSVLHKCNLVYFSTHPSKVWEFGQSLNKVIDYMLSGVPVLASYSGFQSMINEAGSGAFVPAGDVEALQDAICRFATMEPETLRAMGQAGRDWIIANRSYKNLANDYLSILFPREKRSSADAETSI